MVGFWYVYFEWIAFIVAVRWIYILNFKNVTCAPYQCFKSHLKYLINSQVGEQFQSNIII